MKMIPLTQGQVALVDDEDFERFGHLEWGALKRKDGTFYAVGSNPIYREKPHTIYLHRAIMGVTDPKIDVDHKNHDTLDCRRRKNLRICTRSQNMANRKGSQSNSISGTRGVSWHVKSGKWTACLQVNKRYIYLGVFKKKEDAAAAYAVANREHFGEFGGGL